MVIYLLGLPVIRGWGWSNYPWPAILRSSILPFQYSSTILVIFNHHPPSCSTPDLLLFPARYHSLSSAAHLSSSCWCSPIKKGVIRGSILYACDMYYNIKENELRQLERIEEEFLRKIFKTTRGCPITQLYLEIAQHPARFEVRQISLIYLKYILEES